jgi:hypothetical protein
MEDNMTAPVTETTQYTKPLRSEIEALLDVMNAFRVMLEDETKVLKKADFQAVDHMQAQKKQLARQYNEHVATLAARRDEIGSLGADLREALIHARTHFTITLNDNLRALDAARESARRLSDRILETARKAVVEESHTHYSAKGHFGSYKTASRSLNVNEAI